MRYNVPVPKRTLAIAAVLAVTIIWGSTYVAIKVVLAEIPPFTLALARFLLASVVLLPAICLNPAWRIRHRGLDWLRLALLGFTGVTIYFVTENLGLVYTSATSGGLLMAGIPALTAVLSAIYLKERISPLRAGGIAASVVGVVLIILAGDTTDARSSNPLLGNLLLCGSAVVWAIYTILSKSISSRLPEMVISTYSILFGTLFLVPFAGYELTTVSLGPVSLQSWLIVAYLGLVASAGGYFLWNYGLSLLDASVTSTFLNLLPVVTIALAALLLQERLLPLQLVGGALTVAGVYAATQTQSAPAAEAEPRSTDEQGAMAPVPQLQHPPRPASGTLDHNG